MRAKHLWWLLVGVGVLGIGLQVFPYGHAHQNPPIRQEPVWNSPTTRDLAVRACYDCHSNQTIWPWYAQVAPVSWLIQHDVDDGRRKLNFSEWDRPQPEARKANRAVSRGKMPPWYYVLMHAGANLSAAEKQALAQGLMGTIGKDQQAASPREEREEQPRGG
jgi:hypothetical protein